jgi:UDP-N-acetylglucosamine--N-acetylmuramyl-(pentapeptide) pyrophosphoryl-undecaprenol N-acetylglucosamine transferase
MRVLITGGGTGGHVYPALAIARGIKEKHPDAEILFVGTAKGIEADIVPREGYAFRTIEVEGMHRNRFTVKSVRAVLKTVTGSMQILRIIKEFKPTVVVGTGGYVCFSVVLIAALLRIPSLIHEQNAYPGLTNKLLARLASKLAITFPESEEYFSRNANIVLTGLPVRPEILKAEREKGITAFGLDRKKFTVLVAGGSQGAHSINLAMVDVIPRIKESDCIQIIHVTGQSGYEETVKALSDKGVNLQESPNIIIKPYLYNMEEALATANLVICRAGATTIAELTARGLASILIPYPYASANHQEYNAQALVNNRAAKMILDRELNGTKLWEAIWDLYENRTLLTVMSDKSKQMGRPKALEHLLEIVNELNRG